MTDLTHASLRRTLKISFSFRLSAFSFLLALSKASKDFCCDIISALASIFLHLVRLRLTCLFRVILTSNSSLNGFSAFTTTKASDPYDEAVSIRLTY
jgi:hypothetical protein